MYISFFLIAVLVQIGFNIQINRIINKTLIGSHSVQKHAREQLKIIYFYKVFDLNRIYIAFLVRYDDVISPVDDEN